MTRELIEKRWREFPEPILELRDTNPIVRQFTDAYAYGSIVTMNEALFRMVIELSKTTDHYRDELRNQVMQLQGHAMPLKP